MEAKKLPMPPAGQGFYFFFACVSRWTERRRLPPSHWSDWKLFSSKVLVLPIDRRAQLRDDCSAQNCTVPTYIANRRNR